MAKKGGENSKKAAGQARKAQTAADKAAAEDAKKAAAEEAEWEKGAKSNARKEAQAAKKAEQAKKKAEREAALAEEEKSLPNRAGPKKSKTAVKKTNRGLDQAISDLKIEDEDSDKEYSASGPKATLELLDSLLGSSNEVKVDRNAKRRVKAAFAAFLERRLNEMTEDGSGKGLRLSQKRERIWAEFVKSDENPLNNALNVDHNATKEEIAAVKANEKARAKAVYTSKASN
ncbi:uncharacterized protein F4807DRAFT_420746 [Annulohypoxylon truncatum]|uniref:uncharacterized protein n=1 Tax=Annulohypoxylon truncatum TaxID=327061 RepID=UPI0020075940|nr:uncharacterized protein F4807DRAFT_420746 [Annulohypoxylon truncatum]KAI1210888.1 hypothetical protein F4807DRAFT_420746 [Annulohypoxylon truncatum]